jgi:predicted transcriptional regulator
VVNTQAQKIMVLEAACTGLRQEKENATAGYRRLSDKHKALVVEAEQEKVELMETHAMELAGVKEELDKETQDYTDHRLNVRHRLRGLHEVVASSFKEVKA